MIATALVQLIACTNGRMQLTSPGEETMSRAKAAWQPGDEIPGWEGYDYDCPEYAGGNVATVRLPDVAVSTFFILTGSAKAGVVSMIDTTLADCTDRPCSDVGPDPGDPDVLTDVYTYPVTDPLDKTGYYGEHSDHSGSGLIGGAALPVGWYTTDTTEPHWAEEQYCLSRMRPDEMRGIIYVTYHDGTLYHDYYSEALVQYPFDSYYPDHGSWDYDYDTLYGDAWIYLGYNFICYGGDIDYDNAWDWDAITDPDIRNAVYDRYSPYNQP